MKKIIYLLFVVCSMVASSCADSDEIAIVETQSKYQAVFKINPATVVKPFTWEISPGEFTTIQSGYKLRVRALVYNTEGDLVLEKSEQFTNYNVVMSFTTELEKGNYTVIAISDVVDPSDPDVPEFWKLSNYTQLNTASLTSTGYVGYKGNVLGIQNMNVIVSDANNEFKIDIQPAGSILYICYFNYHSYDDIKRYQLEVNQVVDQGLFDSQGNFDCILENKNNQFLWRISILYPEYSPSEPSGYTINYVLPQKNLRLQYVGYTFTGKGDDTEGEGYSFGDELLIPSVGTGEEFYVGIDLTKNEDNNFPVECYNVTGLTFPNLEEVKSSLRSSQFNIRQMISSTPSKDIERFSNVK